MGGSTSNQICFVFVAQLQSKPRVMWWFQVVYSYKFVREDGNPIGENETQLETSHRFNFQFV